MERFLGLPVPSRRNIGFEPFGHTSTSSCLCLISSLLGYNVQWFPFDGIVGLSFAGASVSGETPLFDVLMNNSLVAESVFSLYLTQSPHTPGSTLVLGGTDPKFHLDELNFFPVEQPLVFWMLRLSKISLRESATSAASALNRKTLLSLCEMSDNRKRTREEKHHNYCKAVIDSGTSMISGPTGRSRIYLPTPPLHTQPTHKFLFSPI